VNTKISQIVDTFDGGTWLYLCLRYMDRFHTEPKCWLDLFDFLSYTSTESEIDDYLRLIKRQENNK
jgi:hypothetical protein